jgi:hypothetical protein
MTTVRIRCLAGFLAVTLLLTTSCSTYSGQKLGERSDGTEVAADGVPYNLVRPVYTLSRTPPAAGAADPTYALAVTYVPDSTQRYSLKIRPGALKNPDFNMKFGSGGVLSSTKGTVTEQVTPFITAVAQFAASVIGTLGVFDTTKTSFRETVAKTITDAGCVDQLSDVVRFGANVQSNVAEELASRIRGFKDDDTFLAQFHYLTGRERDCLTVALSKVGTSEKQAKADMEAWEKGKKEFLTANPAETAFVDRVALAVTKKDSDELIAIGAEVRATEKDGKLPPLSEAKEELLFHATAAIAATTQTQLQKALQAFVEADPATWRARHVLFLERQIEEIGLSVLRRTLDAGNANTHLARLRAERALTLGTVDLQKRAEELAKFIEVIKDKSVEGGSAPATAEYAVARAELDAVTAAIDARRARILADAAPPPAPPAAIAAFTDQPVGVVTIRDINASHKPGWFSGTGKSADRFVLVLNRDKETTDTSMESGKSKSAEKNTEKEQQK